MVSPRSFIMYKEMEIMRDTCGFTPFTEVEFEVLRLYMKGFDGGDDIPL